MPRRPVSSRLASPHAWVDAVSLPVYLDPSHIAVQLQRSDVEDLPGLTKLRAAHNRSPSQGVGGGARQRRLCARTGARLDGTGVAQRRVAQYHGVNRRLIAYHNRMGCFPPRETARRATRGSWRRFFRNRTVHVDGVVALFDKACRLR
ncbi:hypothetical protein OH77DRAFT_1422125 [Trametes cingulata]|nr:hypothetical protein OH77DRAFT_1422125 [Trametes cingulata]